MNLRQALIGIAAWGLTLAAGIWLASARPGDTMEIAIGVNATSLSTGRYTDSFQIVDANANPMFNSYTFSPTDIIKNN